MMKLYLVFSLGWLCLLASCSTRTTVAQDTLPTSGPITLPNKSILTTPTKQSASATPGIFLASTTAAQRIIPELIITTKQTSSATPTASPTVMIPSATPTQTATSTVSYAPPEERCLNIAPSLPKGGSVKGTLVLDTSLFDLVTGSKTLIANEKNETVLLAHVSPNGHWLAYEKENEVSGVNQKYLVIANKESVALTIPWRDDWSVWLNWLDNNRLLFRHDREPYSSAIVVDPFVDQPEQELIFSSPNPFIYNAPVIHNGKKSFTPVSFTYYDPSLSRVAFLQSDKEGYWTTLQDLQSGEILTRLPNDFNISTITLFTRLDAPVWISNGKEFLVEAGKIDISDLYRVTQDGKIARLTYLTEIYKYARVRGYSLSYDERYIAFWYWADPYDRYRLATLDTTTGKVIDYCISGVNHDLFSVPDSPVWSPDSHQFVVEVPGSDLSNSQVIWVDVDNQIAAKITKNLTPEGWLSSP